MKQIDAALTKTPPLGQAPVIASFVGAAVAWDTIYYTANPINDSNPVVFRLQCSIRLRMYYDYSIFTNLHIADYPELQTLERGRIVTLYGVIRNIHDMQVDLDLSGLIIKPHHFWDRGY
jgi:hypothetical protein